ncbi:MAG: hypothetical protein KDB23_11285 [Planctomycetales bacterium]|nr:hypothetical protein [Planctomycetales bacterium]
MSHRNHQNPSNRTVRLPQNLPQNMVQVKRIRQGAALSQRTRGLEKNEQSQFAPPERWYESDPENQAKQRAKTSRGYRVVVERPGTGYRHVVTPRQIHERLAQLPAEMVEPLEVVQLSQMTRKKQSFPCYGMQWGTTLYLYPIEDSLVEYYPCPPRPSQLIEARMYGGRWVNLGRDGWQLIWTEAAIRDYYLNNILIHELGHLLDNRNCSYTDRERYAEWFAIEHGYRKTKRGDERANRQKEARRVQRRHHNK